MEFQERLLLRNNDLYVPNEICSKSTYVHSDSRMNRRRRMSLSVRAGITFPVRKFLRKLKKRTLFKVWIKAAVYTSAVVQYLISEILDLAGTITKRLKRKIIKPNHINNALRCDQELDKLTKVKCSYVVPKFYPSRQQT